jgi:hypothetical protein
VEANPANYFDPTGKWTLSSLMNGIAGRSTLSRMTAFRARKTLTNVMQLFACAGTKLVKKEYEIHHIATDKHKTKYTEIFEDIFNEGGLNLNHWANKVALQGHKGRHRHEYHKEVLNHLKDMVSLGKKEAYKLGYDFASEAAKDLIADKITDGLLDIAESLCKKNGKWYKALL